MFDHIGINVNSVQKSKEFYEYALRVLGFKVLAEIGDDAVGFGKDSPVFWIAKCDESHPHSTGTHIAFVTESRESVDTFYNDAILAGGRVNGRPGLRVQYHKNYYGAFVYDLDGNNIEVVCHKSSE